jgi:hypothetical protein
MNSPQISEREKVLTNQIRFIATGANVEMLPVAPVSLFENGELDREFGTETWANKVYESAEGGEGWSRSRNTHRHQVCIDDTFIPIEGYEDLALYIFDHFRLTLAIARWKSQPFQWQIEEGGPLRTPDFLVELMPPESTKIIVQVKTSKFLTADIQADFEKERILANRFGVQHVVWTDKQPLGVKARNLFFRLRRARHDLYSQPDLDALVSEVTSIGNCTALRLVERGYDPTLFPIAIQQGRLFMDLKGDINGLALVGCLLLYNQSGIPSVAPPPNWSFAPAYLELSSARAPEPHPSVSAPEQKAPLAQSSSWSLFTPTVTLAQFEDVRKGVSPKQAADIFGAPGKHVSSLTAGGVDIQTYQWANLDGSNATLTFQNGFMYAKAQFGLK